MMNLEQCEIKQLSDENVRNCKEIDRLKQEIAELKAKVERFKLLLESRMIDPSTTLQQLKRDAVLEAVEPVQSKFLKYVEAVEFAETQQKFVLMGAEAFRNILKSHANNLVKDG